MNPLVFFAVRSQNPNPRHWCPCFLPPWFSLIYNNTNCVCDKERNIVVECNVLCMCLQKGKRSYTIYFLCIWLIMIVSVIWLAVLVIWQLKTSIGSLNCRSPVLGRFSQNADADSLWHDDHDVFRHICGEFPVKNHKPGGDFASKP